MSKQTIVSNTGSQLFVNTDLSKIFIFENRYESDNYVNNSGYDPIVIPAGTVMGRIATSNVLIPFTSNASDGSQNVVGILAQDLSIDSGDTVKASICIYGDVALEQLQFSKIGDSITTVVNGRTVYDKIKSETAGIRLIAGTEMTGVDNS